MNFKEIFFSINIFPSNLQLNNILNFPYITFKSSKTYGRSNKYSESLANIVHLHQRLNCQPKAHFYELITKFYENFIALDLIYLGPAGVVFDWTG